LGEKAFMYIFWIFLLSSYPKPDIFLGLRVGIGLIGSVYVVVDPPQDFNQNF